jgi:N-acetylglucosamine-6-phosphate deacetylase
MNTIEAIHYETDKPVRIVIRNGLIERITEVTNLTNENARLYVAPGLIDNQVNGYAGIDFSGNDLSSPQLVEAVNAVRRDGVTTFLPTLISNSHEMLIKNLAILNESVDKFNIVSESIPGFHLEGPYISPDEGYRGCHPLANIRKPSWDEFVACQNAAGGRILQVTLAPEIEGAMEFIKKCYASKVVVAIGHSNASACQIALAVEYGARLSTHLGNGCANFIHRHNNPIWEQLANEQLMPTVIADGLHLLPEEIKVFYKVKGPDNMILTSDITHLGGMAPGKYIFMGGEVLVTSEGRLINTELNCLAGASFPLIRGVENLMKFTDCSLSDAINMASENVADIYGLNDRGKISIGKRADLIMFLRNGKNLKIIRTYVKGEVVFQTEI